MYLLTICISNFLLSVIVSFFLLFSPSIVGTIFQFYTEDNPLSAILMKYTDLFSFDIAHDDSSLYLL